MADEEKRPEEEAESAEAEQSGTDPHEAGSELDSAAPEAEVAVASGETAESLSVHAAPGAVVHDDSDRRGQAHHDHGGHGHDDGGHSHGGHGDDHFAHTAPASMLIGVFVALILLTILTVGVTAVDLGANGNLIIAMVIATVKAALVMGYFMHMFWDSRFNVLAFTSSFLFLILFLAMALTDRGEYQDSIDHWEADKKAIELAK